MSVTEIGLGDTEAEFEDYSVELNPGDDLVLMQFTGLKDKNGREIYEGDLLRRTSTQKMESGEVHFEYGCWHVSGEGKNYLLYPTVPGFNHGGVVHDVEIIGNIYENPELLR